jgi:hypothetical protein
MLIDEAIKQVNGARLKIFRADKSNKPFLYVEGIYRRADADNQLRR